MEPLILGKGGGGGGRGGGGGGESAASYSVAMSSPRSITKNNIKVPC